MNILVASRVSIPARDKTIPAWEWLRARGHNVFVTHPRSPEVTLRPDVIISMGVTIMEETFQALKRFPNALLFCYNWDTYEWVWKNPRPGEYDYRRYGTLLKQATEVWVPSKCTGLRTHQWWGINNWEVILSSAPIWEHSKVEDRGYIYCALREIPDPHWGLLSQACKELGLPLIMSQHELSYAAYQQCVANCSFLVSHCYELSTGGLSLLEGYYLGKPCLLSNSEWHGGSDYLGDRADYFESGKLESLKQQLSSLWENRRDSRESLADGQDWVRTNYSDEVMVAKMLRRIEHYGQAKTGG